MKKFTIDFRDSLLILPSSLSSLAKAFEVNSMPAPAGRRDFFAYELVNNPDIDLEYKGSVPSYDFFDKSSVSRTLNSYYRKVYIGKIWSLRPAGLALFYMKY